MLRARADNSPRSTTDPSETPGSFAALEGKRQLDPGGDYGLLAGAGADLRGHRMAAICTQLQLTGVN
jgi:hypothetical protein